MLVFTEEYCPDDHRGVVWRYPDFNIAGHTGQQQSVMILTVIYFDSRMPLVLIIGTLTAQRCVVDILRPALLPFLLRHSGFTSQENYIGSYATLVALNILQVFQTLPWPACLLISPA